MFITDITDNVFVKYCVQTRHFNFEVIVRRKMVWNPGLTLLVNPFRVNSSLVRDERYEE